MPPPNLDKGLQRGIRTSITSTLGRKTSQPSSSSPSIHPPTTSRAPSTQASHHNTHPHNPQSKAKANPQPRPTATNNVHHSRSPPPHPPHRPPARLRIRHHKPQPAPAPAPPPELQPAPAARGNHHAVRVRVGVGDRRGQQHRQRNNNNTHRPGHLAPGPLWCLRGPARASVVVLRGLLGGRRRGVKLARIWASSEVVGWLLFAFGVRGCAQGARGFVLSCYASCRRPYIM
ncbi:hypothetical protein QBC33DRAFT_531659, partial [Phialemonium atrogriseum]